VTAWGGASWPSWRPSLRAGRTARDDLPYDNAEIMDMVPVVTRFECSWHILTNACGLNWLNRPVFGVRRGSGGSCMPKHSSIGRRRGESPPVQTTPSMNPLQKLSKKLPLFARMDQTDLIAETMDDEGGLGEPQGRSAGLYLTCFSLTPKLFGCAAARPPCWRCLRIPRDALTTAGGWCPLSKEEH